METASVSHDEEHQHAVISFADGAKIQQNSETTKDLAKKNCLLSYHSALIAVASVKAAKKEHWKPSYRETDLLSKQLPFPVLMVQRYEENLKLRNFIWKNIPFLKCFVWCAAVLHGRQNLKLQLILSCYRQCLFTGEP